MTKEWGFKSGDDMICHHHLNLVKNIHNLVYCSILKEYFYSMIFLGGEGYLQDSGKPRNSGKTQVTKLSAIAGFYCTFLTKLNFTGKNYPKFHLNALKNSHKKGMAKV